MRAVPPTTLVADSDFVVLTNLTESQERDMLDSLANTSDEFRSIPFSEYSKGELIMITAKDQDLGDNFVQSVQERVIPHTPVVMSSKV